MSYHHRRRTPRAMGDLSTVITTAADVTTDPYFAEVVCRIGQLRQRERGEPVGQCPDTPDGLSGGVGIRPLMPVLRAYVYAQQNPWTYWAAAIAAIGIPMWVGYELGRKP